MDTTAVVSAFRLLATEFADVEDNTLDQWLSLTAPLVNKRKFGKVWAQALALLTAHRMKLAAVGQDPKDDPMADVGKILTGSSMRVSSYSEGSVSMSFSSNAPQLAALNAEYGMTQYGVQYLNLLRTRVMSITSAGEPVGRI